MTLGKRVSFSFCAGLALSASLLAVAPAMAQGPGGAGMPPQMMAKIKAWQKWNDSHKGIQNLQTMLFQVREMDKDPGTRLTKPQAAKMLSVMKQWQGKPTMTDDQAKVVSRQIGALLNDKQLKKMTTMVPPWKRGGGMGGGRPGGGGGGGARPGGGRPGGPPGGFQIPDPPKGGYNPMNAKTLPFAQMRPMAQKMQSDFVSDLQHR